MNSLRPRNYAKEIIRENRDDGPKIKVSLGFVRPQTKVEPDGEGGLISYGRSLKYDQYGQLTEITDWTPLGRLYYEKPDHLRYRWLWAYLLCVAVGVCGGLYSLHVLS